MRSHLLLLLACVLAMLIEAKPAKKTKSPTIPKVNHKAETDCRMKELALRATSTLLPGCRKGDVDTCQSQLDHVFEALKDPSCVNLTRIDFPPFLGDEQSSVRTPTAGNTLYVSPDTGLDTNSGLGANTALRTLSKALDIVAQWQRLSVVKTIVLLPGTHRITQTLEISDLHANLQIVSREGALVTSLIELKDLSWTPYTDAIAVSELTEIQVRNLDTYSQLFVDRKPLIRARYPNQPLFTEFAYSTGKVAKWGKGSPRVVTKLVKRDMTPPGVSYVPNHGPYQYNEFTRAEVQDDTNSTFFPPMSYFFSPKHMAQGACPYTLPTSASFANKKQFPTIWKQPSLARFHALHWYGWGLWTFQIAKQTQGEIVFGKGGWQESRGDCGRGGGQHWFVDNALELLDSPDEFFLDVVNRKLYVFADRIPSATQVVEMRSNLISLFRVNRSHGILFSHLDVFGSGEEITMKPFEVPSGGDWSLHRSALLFIRDSTNITVEDSKFHYVGGNALFVDGNSRFIKIKRNDLFAIGSSAVIVSGDPGYFSETPWIIERFPENVEIEGNVARDIGLSVKQSSGVMVSLSKKVLVRGNVFFRGPRAGITFNDQFGGGHHVVRNVVFDQTRETSDNGPFIVWHRQQYEESVEKEWDVLEDNFFLGSFGVGSDGGGKGINVDDGSFKLISTNNVVVWGFQKIKGASVAISHNLFVNPIMTSCVYFSYLTRQPAELSYTDNVCLSSFPPYAFGVHPSHNLNALCSVKNFVSQRNIFLYDGVKTVMEKCAGSWAYWTTKWGQDFGSTLSKTRPDANTVETMVRTKLTWIP